MELIDQQGAGVVVLIRHGEASALSDVLSNTQDTPPLQKENRLLEYGLGAQILSDIGVEKIILLSNSKLPKIVGLDKYNLEIVGHQPIE